MQHPKRLSEWRNSTWRIRLTLDAPFLKPPAVLWAIFDEDPEEKFRNEFKIMYPGFRDQLDQVQDPAMREDLRVSQLVVTWEKIFRSVTGDKVGLLASAPGLAHLVSSNAPGGKKWIATKVNHTGTDAYCWSISFDAAIGREFALTLNNANALNLLALVEEGDS